MAPKSKTPTGTKSDRFRDDLKTRIATGDPDSHPIADAARAIGIGYAFAYGIAKRAGLAEKGAGRRPDPNSKIARIIAAVRPEWSADRVSRTAAALAAGGPVPAK